MKKGIVCFFIYLVGSLQAAHSQDPGKVSNQLYRLLQAYPNGYEKGVFYLDGSKDRGAALADTGWGYSFILEYNAGEGKAKEVFENWTRILDQIKVNGIKLLGKPLSKDDDADLFEGRQWKLDPANSRLDRNHKSFRLQLKILDFRTLSPELGLNVALYAGYYKD